VPGCPWQTENNTALSPKGPILDDATGVARFVLHGYLSSTRNNWRASFLFGLWDLAGNLGQQNGSEQLAITH
jgi:hypothetical protein